MRRSGKSWKGWDLTMRDREKKMDEIFQRAEGVKKTDSLRRRIAVDAVCAGFSAAALILLLVT